MTAFSLDQVVAVAIHECCTRVRARWAPQMAAEGDDLVALRRVFRGIVIDLGADLGELVGLASAGSCRPDDVDDALERMAAIIAEVVIDKGEMIGREAGAPFASAGWLSDVADQAVTTFRDRVSELRQVSGGRS